MSDSTLWSIAVDAPLPEPLTYRAPEGLNVRRGQLVQVPLGKRSAHGVVLGPAKTAPDGFEVKFIQSIDDEHAPLPELTLGWLEWMSRYYIHPPGPTAMLAFPPLGKTGRARKAPVIPEVARTEPPRLTAEQEKVVRDVSDAPGFGVHLVFGVTGSGKTEIYLRLLEKVLAEGKSGLVLVPEISLTPQLVQRFAARFGDRIAALHSQLTDRERTNQWWDMVEGRKKILIGARSALFCPVPDLGLIVVDEEHEPSFKQEEKLKYHARDAAVALAKLAGAPVVLGSATPSLESWANAKQGKYRLHVLRERVEGRSLPNIEIVDLRANEEPSAPRKDIPRDLPFWMSPSLYLGMQSTLADGDQCALFLNRRGLAPLVLCPLCGHTRQCPNCDINLTLHAGSHLVCHYCDYHENLRPKCTECREGEMQTVGLGTELLEKDLTRLFPERRISRADRDEIQNREDLEDMVRRMENGETEILIGTQMIAKGLDFPKLKLVGLVLADIGFNLPDFRATERSFQLVTQMAGRSGRHVKEGEKPGTVIVQTFNTGHESLRFALAHDYEGFAAYELAAREGLRYPPAGRLLSFRIQAPELNVARETSSRLAARAQNLRTRHENYAALQVLGPAEAPLARLRNQFRFQLLLKGDRSDVLNAFARQVLGDGSWLPPKARVLVDVDPVNLL